MDSTFQPSRKWDLWPVALVAFFILAVAGCIGFVVFCSLHPAELVAQDYYEQEMRYQSQIQRATNARKLEGGAAIGYDAEAGAVVLCLPPAQFQTPVKGRIELYRPSATALDRRVALAPDTNGRQQLDARGLSPGLWKVKVFWTAGSAEYYVEQPVVIVGPPRT
jgi:hypothetical protein